MNQDDGREGQQSRSANHQQNAIRVLPYEHGFGGFLPVVEDRNRVPESHHSGVQRKALQAASIGGSCQVEIGNRPASVSYAGQVFAGEFQFNLTVPSQLQNGDQPITATYNSTSTQPVALLPVHN